MPDHAFPAGLREALLFLATAGIVVPVFHRLKISPVLGFIVVGMTFGPLGLGRLTPLWPWLGLVTFTDVIHIAEFGEFGVVFLMFMIGLELSLERLSAMRRLVFGLGPLQVVVSGAVLGAVALWQGTSLPVAFLLGAALALSSTAIVVPVLAERKRLNSAVGRTAFALLLFQDLAVAPLLFVAGVLSAPDQAGFGFGLIATLVPALLGVIGIVILGRVVLRPLFHLVAETRSTEFFMAACLFVLIGTSAVAAMSGLSMALGAFMAGLLLAETEYRREIEVTIEPFKGLLLGLFFVSVGAGLDLSHLLTDPLRVLVIAVLLVAIKALILLMLARGAGLSRRVSVEVALLLGPGGEFAFVILGVLLQARLLDPALGADVLGAVTLSMLALPALAFAAERVGRRLQPKPGSLVVAEPPPIDRIPRVIIVGFGRVGRLVSEMLAIHKIPFLAVDDDPALVARERANGTPIYFGDATRAEFLRRCGLENARALAVTVNAPRIVEQIVALGRVERRDLTIVARARDADQARRLYELGATDAVPETIEASLQLSEVVLVDVGVPMGLVIASVHEKRDVFRALLHEPGGTGERRAIRRTERDRGASPGG